MRKHHIFDSTSLYKLAIKLVKDESRSSIFSAIRGLISKKVLFEGKVLSKDVVLGNETRRQVFDIIRGNPGLNFSKIRFMTGIETKTLLLHLHVLEKFEFIRAEAIQNNKVFFEHSLGNEFDVLHYYLQKEKMREIMDAVFVNPRISLSELVKLLKGSIPASTAYRKVRALMENGLLSGTSGAGQITDLDIPSQFRAQISIIRQDLTFDDAIMGT